MKYIQAGSGRTFESLISNKLSIEIILQVWHWSWLIKYSLKFHVVLSHHHITGFWVLSQILHIMISWWITLCAVDYTMIRWQSIVIQTHSNCFCVPHFRNICCSCCSQKNKKMCVPMICQMNLHYVIALWEIWIMCLSCNSQKQHIKLHTRCSPMCLKLMRCGHVVSYTSNVKLCHKICAGWLCINKYMGVTWQPASINGVGIRRLKW